MTCGLTICSCSAAPSVNPTPTPTTGQLTPLLDNTLSTPRWFTGTDGSGHLVYELMLTNAVPAPVTLNTVEVHDAVSGATLARLTDDSLRAAASLATSPELPSVEVPPAAVTVVWLDISVPA